MVRSLVELWGNLWQWLFGGARRPKEAAAEESDKE